MFSFKYSFSIQYSYYSHAEPSYIEELLHDQHCSGLLGRTINDTSEAYILIEGRPKTHTQKSQRV